jgi:hypothetical protein
MRKKQHQEDEQEQQDLGSLPEGPLVEILSRVPYASLCRFKCVSRPWLALCSAPDIRRRSPQTLSGFFYKPSMTGFCNLSGRGPHMVDPFLSFLDKSYDIVIPEHCCGGLVLCRCQKSPNTADEDVYSLVVCNPATENWIELPPCPIGSPDQVEDYLGFDPTAPSRFVVFVVHLVEFGKVAIYSSGRWTTVQSGWIDEPSPLGPSKCVFLMALCI